MTATPSTTPDATAQVAPLVVTGFSFGDFLVNVDSYELLKDGKRVELTSKVFDTLVILLRHHDRVVTKDDLMKALWSDAIVTDDSLVQCISALRRALGDDASNPQFIATIARRGYRFIGPVAPWTRVQARPVYVAMPSEPAPARLPAPMQGAQTPSVPPQRQSSWFPRLASLAGGLALLVVGTFVGAGVGLPGRELSGPGPLRFEQAPAAGTTLTSGGAISPDSRYVAFTAEDDTSGLAHLWVRALNASRARRLDGTDGATRPFWSPDSQFVGFFADGRLKTVGVAGGTPTDLTAVAPRPSGAAWGPDGQILFSTWLAGLSSVSATGGEVTRVTELKAGHITHAWPQFLPDGDHYLYSAYVRGKSGTYVGSLREPAERFLLETDPGAVYVSGFLLFTRSGILTAQPFDAATLAVRGEPFSIVAGNVVSPSMTNGTMLSASINGVVAFGGATGESELAWFNRRGERLGGIASPVPLHNPALSLDETQLFGNTAPPSAPGLWRVDLERGVPSRLLAEGGNPTPSPDGRRVAFTSSARRPNTSGIFAMPLSGDGASEDALLLTPESKSLQDWSRDGGSLLYQEFSRRRDLDIWMLPMEGTRVPVPVVQTPANEIHGRISPDGRWIAYASDESGRWEVYVRQLSDGSGKQSVSVNGGAEPQWRRDGRELFYLAQNHFLMAVDVTPGDTLQFGKPRALFRPITVGEPTTYRSHYVASANGQRFVFDAVLPTALEPITVLINWMTPAN